MVTGIAVAIIAVMVVSQVWQTYEVTVATARRDIQQLSQFLEANTDVTFQSAEMIIDHAVEEVLDIGSGATARPQMGQRFIDIADKWPFIHSLGLIGPNGKFVAVVLRKGQGSLNVLDAMDYVDMSREPLFTLHRAATNGDKNTLYIARPGRDVVSQEWVIAISKPVYDRQGAFQGVCIVTVALETFTSVFNGLLPARFSSIELYRRDGVRLLSTAPNRPRGLAPSEELLFKEYIPTGPSGVYRVTSPTADRLFSYRVLQRYPLVVAATANWDLLLERWRESSLVLVASALIGLLVIIALTWWLIRRLGAEQVAQRALERSQSNLMESQRLGGIGYFERPIHERTATWSPLMYAIHGVDPATFSPTRGFFQDLVVEEDRPKLAAAWEAADARQIRSDIECRIRAPGQGIRNIRYSWRILPDETGEPSRFFGVAQDVTEIRQAESIIREDEDRMRDIVECSSDYIWEMDTKGTVRLFSGPGFEGAGSQHSGTTIILSNHVADIDEGDREHMRQCIKDRLKFRSLLIPTKNIAGELRWLRVSGNPRFDAEGRYLGYRGAGSDVTELRQRHAQDEASRKAEALGRLASGLAHEINNLLQPIMIYANFGVAQTDLAANIRQYFSRIGRAAERSMLIVRNVLSFARQSPPSRQNVEVIEVVRETMDFIGAALPQGVVLDVRENADELAVRVDRTGLGQVLTNLLSNAAEALPRSGGRIVIAVREVNLARDAATALRLSPGLYCCLEVEDNGHGIPAHQIDQVFDPFFTTKPQGKGTGLGLSVVAGLAKSWGGTVTLESMPDVRTCFRVYLPVVERQLQAAQ